MVKAAETSTYVVPHGNVFFVFQRLEDTRSANHVTGHLSFVLKAGDFTWCC